MTDILVKIKNLSIITIIASLIICLVLIIRPGETLQIVSLICGVSVILLGIAAWIIYFVKDNSMFMAVLGTISLIAGIIVCVKYKSIITIVLILFGAFLIVSGVIDLLSAIKAKKIGGAGWKVSLAMSGAMIIVGIVVTVNPFTSMEMITRFLGIGLICYAVMDLIAYFQIKRVAGLETVVDKNITEINITKDDIE